MSLTKRYSESDCLSRIVLFPHSVRARFAPSNRIAELERWAKQQMAITFDNIFSGVVGAGLGIAASYGINWFNRRRDSRLRLAEVLFEIRHVAFHEQYATGKDDSPRVLRERYLQVKNLTFAALQWCYPWEREKLITAWKAFKGPKTSQFKECDHQYDIVHDYKDLYARTEPLVIFLKI